jgi:hypothetical protein
MFCINCGARLSDGAKFCASCGAKIVAPPDTQPDTQPAAEPAVKQAAKPAAQPASPQLIPATKHPPALQPLKNKLMDLLKIPTAVILILLGIGQLALPVVGSTTTAQVTGYEQKYIINNDESTRNPSLYKLEYQFSVNGEHYTGSVTRVFPGGSHMRQTLPVRYLPFWPYVNAEDAGTVGLAGPVMMGLGILVLVLEVKRKSRLRNKS